MRSSRACAAVLLARERMTQRQSGRLGEQGLLFGDDVAARPEGIGYRGLTACLPRA